MKYAYTKDQITGKLASFNLPDDVSIDTQEEREYIIGGLQSQLNSKNPVFLLITPDNKVQEQEEDIQPELA